jgi:hypothetical protein
VTGKINTLAKLDAIVADAVLARTDAGQTFTGPQAFSSTTRPTSAGTGAPAENSLVTLADADNSQFNRLGQILGPRKAPALDNSASPAGADQGGVGTIARLNLTGATASSANAWSRAILADGLSSNPDYTGAGIQAIPVTLAVSLMSNIETSNQVIRMLVGTTGASPAVAGSPAFSARGFGLEIISTNTSTSIRAIAHDGTTYFGSAPLVQISTLPLFNSYVVFEIKSNTLGAITATARAGRTILGTSTISTGPNAPLGGRYVEINASTNATPTTAFKGVAIQDWAIKLY